ncbi:MAG: hypothetical protein M3O36_08360 [Myxococcota bacterium]|nr:hypothetical protein [Myxococcota bacterium]
MSVGVDVLVVGAGIFVGRWIGRAIRARRSAAEVEQTPSKPIGPIDAEPESLAAFPCQVGDVVVRTFERDEAWLAGALVFADQKPEAALFIAPEAGTDRALLVHPEETTLVWLAPLAKEELALTEEPPLALEHAAVHYQRARRLPVRVSAQGQGAPDVGPRAILAEYTGAGSQRLVVVAGTGQTLAWRGVALASGEYDILPCGKPQ